jgi:N-methylhydantoinase A/oxoprolinase/acetone carboxylase beta subunit
MLNRLLSRQGRRIGAIVSAGQEDYLRIERGIQTSATPTPIGCTSPPITTTRR